MLKRYSILVGWFQANLLTGVNPGTAVICCGANIYINDQSAENLGLFSPSGFRSWILPKFCEKWCSGIYICFHPLCLQCCYFQWSLKSPVFLHVFCWSKLTSLYLKQANTARAKTIAFPWTRSKTIFHSARPLGLAKSWYWCVCVIVCLFVCPPPSSLDL